MREEESNDVGFGRRWSAEEKVTVTKRLSRSTNATAWRTYLSCAWPGG